MRFVVVTHALLPNGPAQRLVTALEAKGHDVALCAVPMLGADRTRHELHVTGANALTRCVDLDAPVPWTRLVGNALEIRRFLRILKSRQWGTATLIACDALAFLMAVTMAVGTQRLRPRVVYFVDYSPQRLERRLEGLAYRAVTRLSTRLADASATITEEAKRGFASVLGETAAGAMHIVPNLSMNTDSDVPWHARPARVVSLGGLRTEHGASLLAEIVSRTRALAGPDVEFDIAGRGPEYDTVVRQCGGQPNVTFHGTLESAGDIGALLGTARVGLALYDPRFPMFAYNSPLKIRDYLAAGLKVVTTWPPAIEDGDILPVAFTADAISIGVANALELEHGGLGPRHRLVTEGDTGLDRLLGAIALP